MSVITIESGRETYFYISLQVGSYVFTTCRPNGLAEDRHMPQVCAACKKIMHVYGVVFMCANGQLPHVSFSPPSFISLLQVELAQPRGDAGIARPWSKHSEGSSRSQKLTDEKKRKEAKAKGKSDAAGSDIKAKKPEKGKEGGGRGGAEKEEFMAALKKRSEARFWDNDDAFADQPQSEAVAADEDEDEDEASGASSDEEDESSLDGGENTPAAGDGATIKGVEGDRNKKSEAVMSNMDWLRSKVGSEGGTAQQEAASTGSDSDEGEEAEGAGPSQGAVVDTRSAGRQSREKKGSAKVSPPSAAAAAAGAADALDEGSDEVESGLSVGRLFVRNLPYTSTEDDLRELFETFGALSEVHLPVDDVKKVRHLGCRWSVHL